MYVNENFFTQYTRGRLEWLRVEERPLSPLKRQGGSLGSAGDFGWKFLHGPTHGRSAQPRLEPREGNGAT